MSTEARARNFTRYGAISAALLLAAGSITLLGVPAYADPPAAGSCDNAPKEGAEYLSDPCDWRALEGGIESAGQQSRALRDAHTGPVARRRSCVSRSSALLCARAGSA